MAVDKKSVAKKAAGLFVVLAVILLALYFGLFRPEKKADFLETAGVIEATEVELSSKTPGTIEWMCCREGNTVAAGKVAVRIDARELRARIEEARAAIVASEEALKEAEANLENSKVNVDSAGYELEAASSEVERVKALTGDARENLERAKGLFKDGYISKRDLDSAQTTFDANSAQLNSALARKKGAEAAIKAAEVNIKVASTRLSSSRAKKAQTEANLKVLLSGLRDTEIISPIDGVVVYKAFETGEVIPTGTAIYTVFDLKDIWARVDIEETDIEKIRLGNPARISAPGAPERMFDGRVIEVGEIGEFATQKDVTRGRRDIKSFRIKVSVLEPAGLVKPGMTVNVRIYFKQGN